MHTSINLSSATKLLLKHKIVKIIPGLYSLNEKNAAEREANSQPQAAGSNSVNSYAAPLAPAAPAQASYGGR